MDTTLIAPIERIAVAFGVPLGWVVLGVTWIVGIVNSAKVLFPKVLTSIWWPVINFAFSFLYAYATLKGWQPVLVGWLALCIIAWASWIGVKRAAEALGMRGK